MILQKCYKNRHLQECSRVFAFLGQRVSHCQPSTLTQMMFCWIFGDLVRDSTELGIKQVQIQHFIAINTSHNTPSLLWLGISTVLTLEIEMLQSCMFLKYCGKSLKRTQKTHKTQSAHCHAYFDHITIDRKLSKNLSMAEHVETTHSK